MATDLGLGLPMEHAIRACLMAVGMGRNLGLSSFELSDLYYLTLVRMIGCTTDSAEYADYFGDEIAFSRETQHLDYGDSAAFGRWVMESFGSGRRPAERQHMIERLFAYTPEKRRSALSGHCEVAQMLAARLDLGESVVHGLAFVFEPWDGSGAPKGVPGVEQPLGVRLMTLCNELEVHHRLGGRDAAVAMAQKRSGGAFDPALVSAFCSDPDAVLGLAGRPSSWDDLLAAEPEPQRTTNEEGAIEAARAMGDFADLKSSFLAGHSTRVAELAVRAAERLEIIPVERLWLRVGALAHDLGRVTVSTSIWDKEGSLTDADWEAIRLHPYYSERLLSRAGALGKAAQVAGMHHERLNGCGYHRGSRATMQPLPARLLAAADAYVAMCQTRPYRAAYDPDRAGDELRAMAIDGRMDTAAVNAVLAAAGDTGPPVRHRWPAELTDREVDVLRRIAVGDSIQEAAACLHLAPKTVDFHLQNIYAKLGITSRAAATLFAIQNELLPL